MPESDCTKRCGRCKKIKPLADFGRIKQRHRSYCRGCHSEYMKAGAGRYRSAVLAYLPVRRWDKLKRRYGITREQYERLWHEQGGLCAICRQPETMEFLGTLLRLSIDHDHVTGEVRGLLCKSCNIALGKFKDDPEIVKAALDYLLTKKGGR